MNTVCILLSTYNGQDYLRDQLDSLYRQRGVNIHILVRDDGSTDQTIEIVDDYRKKYGKIEFIKGRNVGAKRSFFELCFWAASYESIFDYYAFCDQDDVWYDDKLLRAVSILDKKTEIEDKLWYGDVRLVDGCLNTIDTPSIIVVNNLKGNIVASHSLGCTQVFTHSLLLKMTKIKKWIVKEDDCTGVLIPYHDGWLALVAYSMNAYVFYDNNKCMDYRQHKDNVIGASKSFVFTLWARLRRYAIKESANIKSGKCKTLLATFDYELPADNKKVLKDFAFYKDSFSSRMQLAFDFSIYQYGKFTNVMTFLQLFLVDFNFYI